MAQELKDTLQLPKTDFPMRANLVQREPARIAHWEKIGLYDAIQKKRAAAPAFVLHDGPPFTNGDVHIGTALNKTLKDIVLRYKSLRGFRTPYVPGWDCHGLPIEQKVTRELQEKKQTVTTAGLRQRCDDFAESWIAKQKTQFQRLGVLADWKNEYKTKAPAFEADILRTFAAFIEQGLVYRIKKPVYYSFAFQTALAEAEIEYRDHVSPSIWVKFPVPPAELSKLGLKTADAVSIVIWTTTPWTLPANLAIAVHPEVEYVVAEFRGAKAGRYLVAEPLLATFAKDIGVDTPPAVLKKIGGKALEHLTARHPFIDRASPVVLADYVTTDSGTGCVHTAPGHGLDDYQTGLKYGLPAYCPISSDEGYYKDDIDVDSLRLPDELSERKKISVREINGECEADVKVLEMLHDRGMLLAEHRTKHQYPHCWRSKEPVRFLAQHQWFVRLSENAVRQSALEAIAKVQWIPNWGEARIRGMVESRPDWCISRNRRWGVPIPVFYHTKLGKALLPDSAVVRAIAEKVEEDGKDFWNLWYEEPTTNAEKVLAGIRLPENWPPPAELNQCLDTFDVWIDSGSSHAATLRRRLGGTDWPADLYLEGSDQHRGWFQSSLWTGVIAHGGAPYRTVLTHGFIVDEERKKISKSNTYEKPQTSDTYIAEYGADVMRLWISSQNFRDDIPISKEILSHVGETYRLIRNTFRFQLSNLFDFNPAADAVPVGQLDTLDRWALHQTAELLRQCTAAYEAYEFHKVYQLCNQFCAVTLSATYHDILKDRLYTLGAANPLRRSSQTAIHHIVQTLVRILAPIVTFTADEAWSFAVAGVEYTRGSVHLQDWPEAPAAWSEADIDGEITRLLAVRAAVNERLEALRQTGTIGKALDAAVTFAGAADDPAFRLLEKHRDFLPELFIVSHVSLSPVPGAAFTITARHARELGFGRCPRCWRWVAALQATSHGDLCPRCTTALGV
ncbi:MAG: isoleucine--tRNA ligase [Opitutaceae bacterium]|nr:isoleucine--tRNA ligase [Opitutaceae bacterium]